MSAVNAAVCRFCGNYEFGSDPVFVMNVLPAKAVAVFFLDRTCNQDGVLIGQEAQVFHDAGAVDGGYDAALILRGGGSVLDLACFDDYDLAFTVANCGIPVFTAIGHDRDYHVADMVAYDFVKTPTALADLFIDCVAAEDERISNFSNRLRLAIAGKISSMESALEVLGQRIKAADPRNLLTRGYSLVTDEKGVVLKSAAKLKPGQRLGIMFADGSVRVEIIE